MPARKLYLDWLRVIAFALLILFHTGLLYVPWSYNLKSPRPIPGLDWVLSAFGPWRMVMVFAISGVASRFLIGKLGPARFAWDRILRLMPVILVGMFVVIPPQTWVELTAKGVTDQSYLDFWLHDYLAADQTLVAPLGKTMPTWDHLWFLVYLLVYVLALAGLFAIVGRARWETATPRIPAIAFVIAPALWLAATNLVIDRYAPLTWAFVSDWGAHLKWIGVFAAGVMMARREDVWTLLQRRRGPLAVAAGLLLGLNLACRAWGLATPQGGLGDTAYWMTAGLYGWTMVLAGFGWAAAWLDRPSPALRYLNEAVLPVYVLHQPILLAAAWMLFPARLPLAIEGVVLIAVTAGVSLALYHLAIRPFVPARLLFGLKPRRPDSTPALTATQAPVGRG